MITSTYSPHTEELVDAFLKSDPIKDDATPEQLSVMRQFFMLAAEEAKKLGVLDYEKADRLIQSQQEMAKPVTNPYRMIASVRPAEDIYEDIHVLQTFLACNELLFANEMQNLSFHILDLLKEKNLYRHELKRYANKLKEVTDTMMYRSNDTDRHVTIKQCLLITPYQSYGKDFYEEGGGLLNRMVVAFHKDFELKFKRIRLDNRWMAKEMNLKHPDLVSEIFTLMALAQTDIELFSVVQARIKGAARGRLRSKSQIKSTHSEAMLNAAKNLSEHFVSRNTVMHQDSTDLVRKHLMEFQEDIISEGQFEFFNSQFLALKMDYVEYYLARLRMHMNEGRVPVAQIRNVWHRMGKKHAVQKFFSELGAIKMPKGEVEAWDLSKKIAVSKGDQKAMNSFRRLCVEGSKIEPDKEPDEVWQCRVLRIIARQNKGMLPNDVIHSMVLSHGTKKGVMDRLKLAGFELLPTLRKVRKMKLEELKQLR